MARPEDEREVKHLHAPEVLDGYHFSASEAVAARNAGGLLSIRTELSLRCNLRCIYCCNNSGRAAPRELPLEKIVGVIREAEDLGSRSVVLIGGGEPTIYPAFRELVRLAHGLSMVPVVFTNTQGMTVELVRFLRDHNATVIIKLDSLRPETQDFLAGIPGAYQRIQQGLSNLLAAGFAGGERRKLGAAFVVNRHNAAEIPNIWRFCRTRGIVPNCEKMVPNQRASDLDELMLTTSEWREVLSRLLEIDEQEFGLTWLPYTPLPGYGCRQGLYNLSVTVNGEVRPCSSIHVANAANVSRQSLREILTLPFFAIARSVDSRLTGKCGKCEYGRSAECMGCRGLAYTVACRNGEVPEAALCASDPSCWMELPQIGGDDAK